MVMPICIVQFRNIGGHLPIHHLDKLILSNRWSFENRPSIRVTHDVHQWSEVRTKIRSFLSEINRALVSVSSGPLSPRHLTTRECHGEQGEKRGGDKARKPRNTPRGERERKREKKRKDAVRVYQRNLSSRLFSTGRRRKASIPPPRVTHEISISSPGPRYFNEADIPCRRGAEKTSHRRDGTRERERKREGETTVLDGGAIETLEEK